MREFALKASRTDAGHFRDFSENGRSFVEVGWQHQLECFDYFIAGMVAFDGLQTRKIFVRAVRKGQERDWNIDP